MNTTNMKQIATRISESNREVLAQHCKQNNLKLYKFVAEILNQKAEELQCSRLSALTDLQ